MFKPSRRVSRCKPAFDSLEARGLLSQFAAPGWDGPAREAGGQAAPLVIVVSPPDGRPGPFNGQLDGGPQARPFDMAGGVPAWGGAPMLAAHPMLEPGLTVHFNQPGHAALPMLDAALAEHFDPAIAQADHAATPPSAFGDRPFAGAIAPELLGLLSDRGPQTALPPARFFTGLRAAEVSSTSPTDASAPLADFSVIAAPADAAHAATPATSGSADRQANPPPIIAGWGSAWAVNVVVPRLPSGVPIGVSPATPIAPIPDTPDAEPPAIASPADHATRDEVSTHVLAEAELLQPQGADLITAMTTLDRESIEASINGLIERMESLGGPLNEQVSRFPYLVPVVLTVVAVEVGRRWRRRQTSTGLKPSRRSRSSVLNGLI
jgi:hypothetical protein